MSESESMSEKELAQFLTEEVFSGKPRSVGEALAANDTPEVEPEPSTEEPPIQVADEPPSAAPPAEEEAPSVLPSEGEAEAESEEEEWLGDDENVAWAKKTLGEDPAAWAKSAREKEQHIGRLAREKQEAEQLAANLYEHLQQVEASAMQQRTVGMPLSAQEEAWVEQATSNPLEYARQAAYANNVPLFNAVLQRIAEDNPLLAGNVSAQVQMEMQAVQQQPQNGQERTLEQALSESFARVGISLEESGEAMKEKIGDLGEYHPYVVAMLSADDRQRDLAVQAVYDLVQAGTLTTRKVRDEERAEKIRREGELRREAAGVVTGAPHTPPTAEKSPFVQAMEDEWKARGQWSEE